MGSIFLQVEELKSPSLENPTGAPPFLMRSMKKLVTDRGGAYIGVAVNGKKPFLILGTKDAPVMTPTGVKKIDSPNGEWMNLSISLDTHLQACLEAVDTSVLDTLSKASEMLFDIPNTPAQLLKLKYYNPIIYKKEDSDLDPLISGKVPDDCQIVGTDNNLLSGDKSELVKPGSKVRVVLSVGSLFFKGDNQCRLTVKVAKIQLVEQGEDESDAAGFMFD